jgi:D-glycero-D-manno-heptose 1,7-bisphosphate phosphatase
MHKAVFLDRDGVINRGFIVDGKSYAPRKIEDFKLLPFVIQSVEKLINNGFLVIVITNQPDIANGLLDIETLNLMHEKLITKLKLTDIYFCPHSKNENCECRKPKPGMIYSAVKKYKINISNSFLVGDRASDIEAANAIRCRSIFINRNYKEPKPFTQEKTVNSLKSATNYILKLKKNKDGKSK